MAAYNVMITQANSKLGLEFMRQLLSLPHPPEYIFAAYPEQSLKKDPIIIQDSSKKSKVIIFNLELGDNVVLHGTRNMIAGATMVHENFDEPLEDSIDETKTLIQQAIGNRGLDVLINIVCFTNDESNSISTEILENQFQSSTVMPLMLFQIMTPLLEAAALRNREYNEESKAVFFNIAEDNSAGSNPVSEISKVALNLALNVMATKVHRNVLVFSTCLNLEQDDGVDEIELEKCVASILMHAFHASVP